MRRMKYAATSTPRASTIAANLVELQAKRMTFDQFARVTSGEWDRLATWLWKKWPVPVAVSPEDVRQQMLMAAWEAVETWRASYGVALSTHVVWNAITGAKKWIHTQRRALRRDDHAPSRLVVNMSSLGLPATDDRSSVAGRLPADQDEVVMGLELFGRTIDRMGDADVAVIRALMSANGDVTIAAETTYQSREDVARVAERMFGLMLTASTAE